MRDWLHVFLFAAAKIRLIFEIDVADGIIVGGRSRWERL